jgi:hypothetical protein
MNLQQIREQFSAFQNSRILLTAFELEVFSVLDNKTLTSSQIAEMIQCDPKASDRLLNALTVIGFVIKQDHTFRNTEFSMKYLSKQSPDYMSGMFHINHLWNTWSNLTEAVKTGTAVIQTEVDAREDIWVKDFIEAMHDRAKSQADSSVARIDLEHVDKVMDIGGGSGAFSMAFVKKKNTLKATIFDLHNVTPLTNTYIRNEGLEGKIDTINGNYLIDDIPTGYDLMFLSAVIHSNSYEENEELVRKCVASLNTGGQLIIQDLIMHEARLFPPRGAIFALNMLVGTGSGDTFTESEVRLWMSNAGLKNITKVNLPFDSAQMIGWK